MIEWNIPQEWLTKKLVCRSINFADGKDREAKIQEIAGEFVNLWSQWEQIFGKIGPNDEIWEFDSPGDYWVSFCGRSGIALVRPGEPIEGIATEMN